MSVSGNRGASYPQSGRSTLAINAERLGPRAIAFRLNDEGISAPGSGAWGFSTITGNRARGTGILNNEIYVGKLVWNRQRFIKDPDTGKRQRQPGHTRHVIARPLPRETPPPLPVLGPQQVRLLWWLLIFTEN